MVIIMNIYAGYSRTIITPSYSMPMAGYDGRKMNSAGVHDDLYANCLVIKTGNDILAILSLDVLGVDDFLSNRIKAGILHEYEDINKDGVFVCATHNHSGPSCIFYGRNNYDESYVNFLAGKCIEAFRSAVKSLEKSNISVISTSIHDVAARRNINICMQQKKLKCSLILVEQINGRKIILVNFPCHMTVLDENNLYYTRDLLYYVQKQFMYNGLEMLVYVNGAAGDISTRYTKKAASFEEAERLGRYFGSQLINAVNNRTGHIAPNHIQYTSIDFQAFYRKQPTGSEKAVRRSYIESKLKEESNEKAKRNLESALLVLERKEIDFSQGPGIFQINDRYYKQIRINIAVLGDIVMISIPFEMYYSTGEKIEAILKSKFNCSNVIIAGYCNGYLGYVPPEESFKGISYETEACLFESDTEARLLSSISNA